MKFPSFPFAFVHRQLPKTLFLDSIPISIPSPSSLVSTPSTHPLDSVSPSPHGRCFLRWTRIALARYIQLEGILCSLSPPISTPPLISSLYRRTRECTARSSNWDHSKFSIPFIFLVKFRDASKFYWVGNSSKFSLCTLDYYLAWTYNSDRRSFDSMD